MNHQQSRRRRSFRVGPLRVVLKSDLQPGSGPGKLARARYEDKVLWLHERTPLRKSVRYIAKAVRLAQREAA